MTAYIFIFDHGLRFDAGGVWLPFTVFYQSQPLK